MKLGFFVFAIFIMLSTVGCISSGNTPDLQQQGYENTVNGQVGQAQRLGATVNEGQSEWPGDTVGKDGNYTPGGLVSTTQATGRGITLLNMKTPVNRGGTGNLSIQGKPSVRYSATAVYNRTGKIFTSTIEKTAGADGIVKWIWNVSKDTHPGTYNVMISGGGEILTTAYTVE